MSKVRYRNVTTAEVRDVEGHSPEENLLLDGVTTVNGESRPLWIPNDEYEAEREEIEAERAARSTETVVFGSHHRRLTPGEVAMGISSYDQKEQELGGGGIAELDEADEDEEEDESGVPEPPAAATTTAPQTTPRPRASRAAKRRPPRRAAARGK